MKKHKKSYVIITMAEKESKKEQSNEGKSELTSAVKGMNRASLTHTSPLRH